MGQQVIIVVLGMMSVLGIILVQTNNSVTNATESSVEYYTDTYSRNLSYSAAQLLLTRIGDDADFRAQNGVTAALFNGSILYSVKNTVFNGDSVIVISSSGIFMGDTTTSTIHVEKSAPPAPGVIPDAIRGSLTMSAPMSSTVGTFTMDGRNHDLDGSVSAGGGGQVGVWTTGLLIGFGNTQIGGYDGTNSYAPSNPPPDGTYKFYASSADVPTTPDEVLGGNASGYPPGTLKAIAQSGASGSQYVTDPSLLTYPLKGVTFVELADNAYWQNVNIEGDGMLIVSNSSTNAEIRNINQGTFKGVLVADRITKLDATVIGSTVTLSSSLGNIGSGNGKILYSSEAIKNATQFTIQQVAIAAGGGGTTQQRNYGFGNARVFVLNWYE